MARRDLQGEAKKTGRPWEIGKAFEHSAPCSDLVPASEIGHPAQGAILLKVNGALRQEGNLDQMIWKVPEMISYLSGLFELAAGDVHLSRLVEQTSELQSLIRISYAGSYLKKKSHK